MRWRLLSRTSKWPAHIESEFGPTPPPHVSGAKIRVTFVNHATILIQTEGLNILTDPIWSERASPVSWIGPKRVRAPGISFDQLPRIDVVIVSHNHYDHMDIPTLSRLYKQFSPDILVPTGNALYLQKNGIRARDLDWWQTVDVKGVQFTLVPARHFSARSLFDACKTLWGGFVIKAPLRNIYFAGDTGYGQHFRLIREKFGPMTLCCLPIGAFEPRWFMEHHHLNPDDAVKAHLDLGSSHSIGMHFGTFQLTNEAVDAPVQNLHIALKNHRVDESDFITLAFGASFEL
jgi:L-ascorbate metabolism protein UlaG (beta-lactamase superfamily)